MADSVLVYRNTKMQFRKFREFINFVSKPEYKFVGRKENLWIQTIDMCVVSAVLCEYHVALGHVSSMRAVTALTFVCVKRLNVYHFDGEKLKIAVIQYKHHEFLMFLYVPCVLVAKSREKHGDNTR
jgi:hypothetical protein